GDAWAFDFEWFARDGELPNPLCYSALNVRTGELITRWRDEFDQPIPYDKGTAIVYSGSGDLICNKLIGGRDPQRISDHYTEVSRLTNGVVYRNATGLVNALQYFRLPTLEAETKEAERNAILKAPPYGLDGRRRILEYCGSDAKGSADLLRVMLPKMNL